MKTVPGDYMQVIGKGEVDYLVLEGEQVEAKNWTFESKYLQISWLTDDEDVSDGFTANIIRIGWWLEIFWFLIPYYEIVLIVCIANYYFQILHTAT